jgi:hypothetical protein
MTRYAMLVPLDRQGIFPATLTLQGDAIEAEAPRAGWSFRLRRDRAPHRVGGAMER